MDRITIYFFAVFLRTTLFVSMISIVCFYEFDCVCVYDFDCVCFHEFDCVCFHEFDCVCFHDFDFVSFRASRMISLQFLRRHILSMNAITDVHLISIFLSSTLIQFHVYVFVFNSTLYLLQDITATHTLLLCKHKGNSMVLWCTSTAVS